MRIGIEAQRLQRPHKHGMDRVALELIKNLQEIDKKNEYFIFVKPDEDKKVISNTSNFTVVEVSGGAYPIWEQVKLPKIAKSYNCDVLHCTSNTAPVFTKTPLITTIHDVIYMEGSLTSLLRSSASNYQKFGNLYRRLIVKNVVKKSKKVITVSNYEKANIQNCFGLYEDQITAIHNGVSNQFLENIGLEHIERVKEEFNLPTKYAFHIANKDPRKNTKRVLKAFQQFLRNENLDFKLVMLGCSDTELKILLKEINATEVYNHILLPGYVSDEDLPVFYQLAQVFLFPSLKEGFGIPIIEAMASKVPVITSNVTAMPEVSGDAAHIVDPYSVDEISNAMVKITSNQKYKNELIEKGVKQFKNFSWNAMAMQVLEQYNQLFQEQKR